MKLKGWTESAPQPHTHTLAKLSGTETILLKSPSILTQEMCGQTVQKNSPRKKVLKKYAELRQATFSENDANTRSLSLSLPPSLRLSLYLSLHRAHIWKINFKKIQQPNHQT